jgi:hypothetical protein
VIYIQNYFKIIRYKFYFLFVFYNLLFRYKADYLRDNPINEDSNSDNNDQDEDNLDIYITNKEDFIEDELISYLEEKRADKKVSKYLNSFNLFIIFFYKKYIYKY